MTTMKYVVALLLSLISLAAFHAVMQAGFVRWDDDVQVYQNPGLNPPNLAHLASFWRAPYDKLYIPVSYTAFSLLAAVARRPIPIHWPDAVVTALDPRLFHLVGLLLHLGCTLLVYALLCRFVRSEWASGAGALLFGLHPMQVESVAWASELRGLLMAFFSLLALHAYLNALSHRTEQPPCPNSGEPEKMPVGAAPSSPLLSFPGSPELGRRGRFQGHLWYAAATLCFGLALLSKPTAVILPLLAAVLDGFLVRRPVRSIALSVGGWLAVSVVFLVVTSAAQPVPSEILTAWWTRPLIALDSVAFFLGKLVWPASLGIDYGRTPLFVMAHGWVWGTALIAPGLGLLVWRLRLRWLSASALIFLAALLPTLGLVPFMFQAYSTVADRYIYLALLGPSLALACALDAASRRLPIGSQRTVWAACACVLVLLGTRTVLQVNTWRNSVALFTQALTVNPNSFFVRNNLGNVLVDTGHWDAAIAEFRAASELRPDEAKPRFNLAAALLHQGDVAGAAEQYQVVVQLRPYYPPAHNNLGCVLSRLGRWTEADAEFRAALRCDPAFAEARLNLTVAEAVIAGPRKRG